MRLRQGYDGAWSTIAILMFHPGRVSIFGHRLLFVGVAWIFRLLSIFSADVLYCYYLPKSSPCCGRFPCWVYWSGEYLQAGGRFAAYPLLALMLVSTLDYYTYFDIAIVGFYAGHAWYFY